MAKSIKADPAAVQFLYDTARSAGRRYRSGDEDGAVSELRAAAAESTHPDLRQILTDMADNPPRP